MDHFLDLIDRDRIQQPRVESFSAPMGKGSIEGRFYQSELSDIGVLRALTLVSAKISVITLFFYPKAELALPIYACEYVNLNDKRFIVAIDAPLLAGDDPGSISNSTENLFRNQFGSDSSQADLPDWYRSCSSGYQVFSRADDQASFASLWQTGLNCWKEFADSALETGRQSSLQNDQSVAEHHQRIQDYKHHHHINSPGLPLLNSCFGEAWVQRFMTEDFFA